jgi:hypothetical protein
MYNFFITLKNALRGLKKSNFKFHENYFKNLNNYEIFKKIYDEKIWTPENKKKEYQYYSGLGSHDSVFATNYINKVKKYLKSLPKKPKVVDLGCGDFNIGSKIRRYCDKYTAIDIYDELINRNKKKYKNLDVNFLKLDFTKNSAPKADIYFIRCVFQHLSNESILNFLRLSKNRFKIIILTEHLPGNLNFIPNLNMATGSSIRLYQNSGIDLTRKPFNLLVKKSFDICKISSNKIKGILKTTVLEIDSLYKN